MELVFLLYCMDDDIEDGNRKKHLPPAQSGMRLNMYSLTGHATARSALATLLGSRILDMHRGGAYLEARQASSRNKASGRRNSLGQVSLRATHGRLVQLGSQRQEEVKSDPQRMRSQQCWSAPRKSVVGIAVLVRGADTLRLAWPRMCFFWAPQCCFQLEGT